MKKRTCIIITGPTAIGKTTIAIELARHFSTRIISSDSRQCFKELNIGVAKPSPRQLQEIPHYFIDSHHITDPVNAAVFEQYALEKANEIFETHDVAVMVGGTGLYIKAFCEGLDEVPIIQPGTRERIVENYEANGLGWLQEQLQLQDPEWYAGAEQLNPHRLMRALEVKISTGRSLLSFQHAQKASRDFNIILVGLELPRPLLYERINTRVDQMMDAGLLNEVVSLQQYKKLNALQTVGYKELFSYLDGEVSLEQATELIRQNTRQYAKRQMTWFKKNPATIWCAPEFEQVMKGISSSIV